MADIFCWFCAVNMGGMVQGLRIGNKLEYKTLTPN